MSKDIDGLELAPSEIDSYSDYSAAPTGFQTYFGGMYSSECFDLALGAKPKLIEFDTALPLSGIAFVPGTLALDVSGVYQISYEITLTSWSYTIANAQVLACGNPIRSASYCIELKKNAMATILHTTYARLNASDEIELQLTAEDDELAVIRSAQLTIFRMGA
ncbi:MAG: hypothetical protein FWG30_09050 [Eubacteriaceae bacterium]|nr:hypothetical protein [Eubacteriaceae bacterium]